MLQMRLNCKIENLPDGVSEVEKDGMFHYTFKDRKTFEMVLNEKSRRSTKPTTFNINSNNLGVMI